ncbi:hypothetical protein EXIGLDRAFT_803466 [Exidia glandulosa HHB12029]|uniref:ABC transporter domain-containing protein n=1 Tax=Exidia glandulosa HHB12029 TaxID=1314781 RepID=A0A165Q7T2_EXIGL|nr:hypothetical protein EXIGLDRAFT_803466 [Exidia glandulosa HHB12029]
MPAIDRESEFTLSVAPGPEEQIQHLARQITRQSLLAGGQGFSPFDSHSKDTELDPNSAHFNFRAWISTLVNCSARNEGGHTVRTDGVSFRNLGVHGFGKPTDFQKDVVSVLVSAYETILSAVGFRRGVHKIQILRNFDGLVRGGEMLLVLGRPGSGCSTFLRTIAGETHGIYVDSQSDIQYSGISPKVMHSNFRGEVIYNAETEVHFPHLTVGQTLLFAAKARTPRNRIGGVSRDQYAQHMRDVVMAAYGLSHTVNTRVGNDFIRGVSGGERKRVSIAETTLSFSPIQCWDNSTRGLDSATALEFIKTLRLQSQYAGTTSLVAIYQASQNAYDLFDKVVVLYEGRQIYFGPTHEARVFFTSRGFVCPERQTTGDFLTSLTSAAERVVAPGYEAKVPRTPAEFEEMWRSSDEHAALLLDIEAYSAMHPVDSHLLDQFKRSRTAQQSRSLPSSSPYTLSARRQIQICIERGFQRMRGEMANFLITVIGSNILALILASVFYNLDETTDSFSRRGAILFYAVLVNAFTCALEARSILAIIGILTLYAQRPIVEKHTRYALYYPWAEAAASMVVDMPSKVIVALTMNFSLYFIANLRREPGAFFVYLLFSFTCTMCMSMVFRTIGASTRSLSQAMPIAIMMILGMVIYTGFVIPRRDMVGWLRWLNYLNPIGYAFESLMVNEFDGRDFTCSSFSPAGPGYEHATGNQRFCNARGAEVGSVTVSGTNFIAVSFNYHRAHLWRNFGVLVAYIVFFLGTYLAATQCITAKKSKGEVLVFRRKGRRTLRPSTDFEMAVGDQNQDEHRSAEASVQVAQTFGGIQRQTKTFHWSDVCYDINIKGHPRRILDHVDGWVKPGTLTALMGASGAGKTTLLDVLAARATVGIVSGEMLVNGRFRDKSFQRKTGYVQQRDLHLETSTVREALVFSAVLRQSSTVPRAEKIAYVEEVIRLLEMEAYADAIVGVPGEGLNVEQRKRLTIGVELVAKPELLLFFDEPTSGLDSQTAWSICQLMRKLANNGQAILCTIHQPSAILIQEFDRLLFLAAGGKTVYFGEMGANCSALIEYFEGNGAAPCQPSRVDSPWQVIGAAPGHTTDRDWHEVWNNSPERSTVKNELAEMKTELADSDVPGMCANTATRYNTTTLRGSSAFAAPITVQFVECFKRVWQQYWRSPTYIYSKLALSVAPSLFIGVSFFQADNSQQGLQSQMFATFLLFLMFASLVQQIHPLFVAQRALYEARERPAKTYSWVAFMLSQILVEFPWMLLSATLAFLCWYYPIGLYRNAIPTDAVQERGALMFLYVLSFFLFSGTFAHFTIVLTETPEAGSTLAVLVFTMSLLFCGVIANRKDLGWWVWMYRLSPFTYFVSGMLSTAVANAPVVCSDIEWVVVQPPMNQTCSQYMGPFIQAVGGVLKNPGAISDCQSCLLSSTNQFLATISSSYDQRWRDWVIDTSYIVFNGLGALFFYWLARVPKKSNVLSMPSQLVTSILDKTKGQA